MTLYILATIAIWAILAAYAAILKVKSCGS